MINTRKHLVEPKSHQVLGVQGSRTCYGKRTGITQGAIGRARDGKRTGQTLRAHSGTSGGVATWDIPWKYNGAKLTLPSVAI